MACIKEFYDKERIYLSITDSESDNPKNGTFLVVHRSLMRPEGIQPPTCQKNFPRVMSAKITQDDGSTTYVLQNAMSERLATNDLLPMLGRSILSNSVRWGTNQFRMIGDLLWEALTSDE